MAYIEWELENDNLTQAEALFPKCLMQVKYLGLWTTYLNYIRRRHNLSQDPEGKQRSTVDQAYQLVLNSIGIDKDADQLWRDYIDFLRSGPGQVGGSGWQDQQKMDMLRKTYHRAIATPMGNIGALWKEYNDTEMGLNKMTVRRCPGNDALKSC